MTDIQQLIEACCLNETIDGLDFWGPTLQLSSHCTAHDELYLRIEGTFELTHYGETIGVHRTAPDKLAQLTKLARQTIALVQLIVPNDLLLEFASGMQLRLRGHNGREEGWQLHAKKDDETVWLVVAGPHEQLLLFE